MTIKATALLTSACVAVLSLLSALYPNDPFFFVISSSSGVVIARLFLVVLLLNLAFQKRFKYRASAYVYGLVAVALTALGLAGIASPRLDYIFSAVKPLDFILFLEMGVLFGLAAVSHEKGTRRLRRISRPRGATALRVSAHRATS